METKEFNKATIVGTKRGYIVKLASGSFMEGTFLSLLDAERAVEKYNAVNRVADLRRERKNGRGQKDGS